MHEDGYLISIANYTDKKDIIGSVNYKTVLSILYLSDGPYAIPYVK